MSAFRDRIKEFRRVEASRLRPSPANWRTHPEFQADSLRGVLEEVGVADAVIARELPGGDYELIDGHLRRETLAGQLVPTLVLDVTEEEARVILATLDPLAALAGRDQQALDALLADVQTDSPELRALLDSLASSAPAGDPEGEGPAGAGVAERFEVLVTCDGERQQRDLYERLTAEGFPCRVMSL